MQIKQRKSARLDAFRVILRKLCSVSVASLWSFTFMKRKKAHRGCPGDIRRSQCAARVRNSPHRYADIEQPYYLFVPTSKNGIKIHFLKQEIWIFENFVVSLQRIWRMGIYKPKG